MREEVYKLLRVMAILTAIMSVFIMDLKLMAIGLLGVFWTDAELKLLKVK